MKKIWQWLLLAVTSLLLVFVASTFLTSVTAAANSVTINSAVTAPATITQTAPKQSTVTASKTVTSATSTGQSVSQPTQSQVPANQPKSQEKGQASNPTSSTYQLTKQSNAVQSSVMPGQLTVDEARQATDNEVEPNRLTITLTNVANHRVISDGDAVGENTPIRIDFNYNFDWQNINAGDRFDFTFESPLVISEETNFDTPQGHVYLNNQDGQSYGNFTFSHSGYSPQGSFFVTVHLEGGSTTTPHHLIVTVNGKTRTDIQITYIPNPQNPNEDFNKYAMNSDLSKGNLEYALRINPSGQKGWESTVISDQLDSENTAKGFYL